MPKLKADVLVELEALKHTVDTSIATISTDVQNLTFPGSILVHPTAPSQYIKLIPNGGTWSAQTSGDTLVTGLAPGQYLIEYSIGETVAFTVYEGRTTPVTLGAPMNVPVVPSPTLPNAPVPVAPAPAVPPTPQPPAPPPVPPVTPPPPPPPPPVTPPDPATISASTNATGGLDITWTVVAPAVKIICKRSDFLSSAGVDHPFTDTNVVRGSTYTYYFYNVDGTGAVSVATVKSFTVDTLAPPPPPPPSGVTYAVPQVLSAQEVYGPLRGAHAADHPDGATDGYQIPGYPYQLEYQRWPWSSVETSAGVYNFSAIIAARNGAVSRGRGYAFAVEPFNPDPGGDGTYPSWLPVEFTDGGIRWPAWNDPAYDTAQKNLIAAIVAQFGNDSAVAFIDMRPWGSWGEGHAYRGAAPYSTLPSTTLKQGWIDAYALAAKPYLLAMTDDRDSVEYGVNTYPKVGLRRDSFSWPGFNGFDITTFSAAVQNRWKTAPFVVENGGPWGPEVWTEAVTQVSTNHLSALKDQNHGNLFATWNPTDRDLWLQCVRNSGERLTVAQVTYPSSATGSMSVSLLWNNNGVSPLYLDYRTELFLVDSGGTTKVVTVSGVSLKGMLPGVNQTVTDTISLTGLAPGTYGLRLRAIDVAGIRPNLHFAINGRLADGSYPLVNVTVT